MSQLPQTTEVLTGHVEEGVVVLASETSLPNGTEVQILPVEQAQPKSFAERYAKFIGVVNEWPEDMAENHDHYLHGAPKKNALQS